MAIPLSIIDVANASYSLLLSKNFIASLVLCTICLWVIIQNGRHLCSFYV